MLDFPDIHIVQNLVQRGQVVVDYDVAANAKAIVPKQKRAHARQEVFDLDIAGTRPMHSRSAPRRAIVAVKWREDAAVVEVLKGRLLQVRCRGGWCGRGSRRRYKCASSVAKARWLDTACGLFLFVSPGHAIGTSLLALLATVEAGERGSRWLDCRGQGALGLLFPACLTGDLGVRASRALCRPWRR